MSGVYLMIVGQAATDWLMPTILFVCVVFSGVSIMLLRIEAFDLREPENLDLFGELYRKMRIFEFSPRASLLWPTAYYTNRFVFSFTAVFLSFDFAWL